MLILTACITIPPHNDTPFCILLGISSSTLVLRGKIDGPFVIDRTFDKSINPWDDTNRQLPTNVKNNEVKITTSGRNIDLRQHVAVSIQNNLEAVKTPRNV